MDWSAVATVGAAIIGVIGIVIERNVRRPHTRERVKLDLEILALLPSESTARGQLQEHIDATITRITTVEDDTRRNPFGMVRVDRGTTGGYLTKSPSTSAPGLGRPVNGRAPRS